MNFLRRTKGDASANNLIQKKAKFGVNVTVRLAEGPCCPPAVIAGRAAAVRHLSSAAGSICLSKHGSTEQWELHQTRC